MITEQKKREEKAKKTVAIALQRHEKRRRTKERVNQLRANSSHKSVSFAVITEIRYFTKEAVIGIGDEILATAVAEKKQLSTT